MISTLRRNFCNVTSKRCEQNLILANEENIVYTLVGLLVGHLMFYHLQAGVEKDKLEDT
jgi:hypothetical protein